MFPLLTVARCRLPTPSYVFMCRHSAALLVYRSVGCTSRCSLRVSKAQVEGQNEFVLAAGAIAVGYKWEELSGTLMCTLQDFAARHTPPGEKGEEGEEGEVGPLPPTPPHPPGFWAPEEVEGSNRYLLLIAWAYAALSFALMFTAGAYLARVAERRGQLVRTHGPLRAHHLWLLACAHSPTHVSSLPLPSPHLFTPHESLA